MKESKVQKSFSLRSTGRAPAKKVVLFEYFDPSAKIVTIAGDFNQWKLAAKPDETRRWWALDGESATCAWFLPIRNSWPTESSGRRIR